MELSHRVQTFPRATFEAFGITITKLQLNMFAVCFYCLAADAELLPYAADAVTSANQREDVQFPIGQRSQSPQA